MLHSLATGFSLASISAFARKVSCTAQYRRSLRRAFGLLLISKIPAMASPAATSENAIPITAVDSAHVANSLTNPLHIPSNLPKDDTLAWVKNAANNVVGGLNPNIST